MKPHKKTASKSASPEHAVAAAEIHAFVGARDLLLRVAESHPTEANLRRALAANDSVQDCLRPMRSPYQAQALSEAEATRERLRCQLVKTRLTELSQRAQSRQAA